MVSMINTTVINKRTVLRLYRTLLLAGRKLKYTDQRYYKNTVRAEFEVQVSSKERERRFELGKRFLLNKLGGLI